MVGICLLSCAIVLFGHGGRTDSQGGHYNRKTGEYHFHNSGSRPVAPPAVSIPRTPASPSPAAAPVNTPRATHITENHWQVALNNNFFRGKLEYVIPSGRVDILTTKQAVEVDKASNYKEGMKQAVRYAEATQKAGVLALYIDGEKNGLKDFVAALEMGKEHGIEVILANCHVSVNDLIALSDNPNMSTAGSQYWLNTDSGVRHNSSCRYYKNTAKGRFTATPEGRPCQICGG